jgi:hypothetical protein
LTSTVGHSPQATPTDGTAVTSLMPGSLKGTGDTCIVGAVIVEAVAVILVLGVLLGLGGYGRGRADRAVDRGILAEARRLRALRPGRADRP